MKHRDPHLTISSWLVAAGRPSTPGSPLNVPLVPASNFIRGGDRVYSRDEGTPSWTALEALVGGLEGGETVVFASGMAAIAAVFDQLHAGAKIVHPDDCYQAVTALAEAGRKKNLWKVRKIPVEDTAAWVEAAASADLLWLESPTNPLLALADLVTICAAPRKEGALLAVDNTFATPLNQRPLDLGADLSMQSATKFLGGHSDLLAGVVTTRNPALRAALAKSRKVHGATPGALESFLTLRGARTMALRLERAQATAGLLASRLEAHPAVERVRYPGLSSHPQHDLARRQLNGFGTIISFDVHGGAEAANAVCAQIELIQHATSLGAVESTMERRATLEGLDHLPVSLLRLSVGIEDAEDLWKDLEQALG